ncbi:hypothetical protein EJB05_00067 [Eragrostis curvula]|uniref:SCP domain-containing protein n=1 Tax=Eragrostis curvula TaxID=38414 RepID=A0A5J9WJB2_9POAL|nr:hypothetical protein EJB05_00067 [Eragrostis curvula]
MARIISQTLVVLCSCLLVAGAAASKSFGGGGYGGEEGVQQQVEAAAANAGEQLTSAAAEATLTPETSSVEASSTSPATEQQAGYGGSAEASSEPLNGLNEKAVNDIINEHNVFRAKEHVPPIKWNTTLAKFSQDYAETLKRDKDCQMIHSDSPYGENLMMGSGALSWKTTVDDWTAEKKSYHYGDNSCDPGQMCGHYTAVIWKDTTSVGCGRVLCANKDTMIVCSYWPPGNYIGKKPY